MKLNFCMFLARTSVLVLLSVVRLQAQGVNLIDQTYGTGAGSFELGTYDFNQAISDSSGYYWTQPGGSSVITGWVTGNNVNWDFRRWADADRAYDIELGAGDEPASISTTLNLAAGVYNVTFALSSTPGFNPGIVQVGAGGAVQWYTNTAITQTDAMAWETNTFSFVATNAGSYAITFSSPFNFPGGGNIPVIDAVSATLAASSGLFQSAFLSNGLVNLVFSVLLETNYQIQFTDHFSDTTWSNLGGIITATNVSLIVSEPVTNSQRFYRVLRVSPTVLPAINLPVEPEFVTLPGTPIAITPLSLSDFDITGAIEAQLIVQNGTLTTTATNGLLLSSGNGTTNLVLEGSLVCVNAALAHLIYTPNIAFTGFEQIQVTANDLGNNFSGVAQQSNLIIPVAVSPVVSLVNVNFGSPGGSKTGPAAIGLTPNDAWNGYTYPGSATVTNLLQADGTVLPLSLTVSGIAGTATNGVNDGMYGTLFYSAGLNFSISVTLSNLPPGMYDFYAYGHGGADNSNSAFVLNYGAFTETKGTTLWGAGWNSTNWEEGEQYTVFRNVPVISGVPVVLVAAPSDYNFAIFNGLQIARSSLFPPTPPPTITKLINVNFGATNGAKTGLAAVGISSNDFWNGYLYTYIPYTNTADTVTNLARWDGSLSPVSMTVTATSDVSDGGGNSSNGVNDEMYGSDIFQYMAGGGGLINFGVTFSNLDAGTYTFYVYGHGPTYPVFNSLFQLASGSYSLTKGTTAWGMGWDSTSWEESQQYVVFRNVVVEANTPVKLTVLGDDPGYAWISGVQITQ